MRLLLPPLGSPKPLFILGAGDLFLLPHLLSSNIKASQFASPNLILPLSLPPTFCKFPCIILRVTQCLVFISTLTFALEVRAAALSPSGSAFPRAPCDGASWSQCLKGKESTARRGLYAAVLMTAFLWDPAFGGWETVCNCSSHWKTKQNKKNNNKPTFWTILNLKLKSSGGGGGEGVSWPKSCQISPLLGGGGVQTVFWSHKAVQSVSSCPNRLSV